MPPMPDDASWAVTELAEANLGDTRRTQRLMELATVLAQRPGASLPKACGSRAMLKAAYRFFDNDAIAAPAILESHVAATTGLGPLAHPAHQGLHVHTTLALTPERVPLGLLAQQVWVRDPQALGKRATRTQRPTADTESQTWLTSVAAVSAAHACCPQTHCVCIGDREADVSDLLVQERPSGVDLLVRASWNRRVDHPSATCGRRSPPNQSWPRSHCRCPDGGPSPPARRR